MKRLFALYIVTIAFFYYTFVPRVEGYRLPWAVGIALVAAAALKTWHQGVLPRPGAVGLVLLFFFVVTVVNGGVLWIRAPWTINNYVRSELQFVLMLGVVFAFARARLSATDVAGLSRVWVWTAGAAAAYAVYQTFARVLMLPQPEKAIAAAGFTKIIVKEYYGFYAASSWFGEPSWLGSFLVVPLVYVVGVLVLDPPDPYRFSPRTTRVLFAGILIALFLSLSQAAYMTVLIVAIPLIWSLRERILVGRTLRFAGVAALLLLVPALALGGLGAHVVRAQIVRLLAIVDAWRTPDTAWWVSSYGPRMINMRAGVEIWSTSPVIGVGINAVPYHPDASRLLIDPWSGAVDSGLLQLLVEQGILGFGALMLALVILWVRLRRVRAGDPDPGRRFMAWFLMWALVTEVVNSIATHPWQHAQHWLVVCLAVGFLAYVDRQPSASLRYTS